MTTKSCNWKIARRTLVNDNGWWFSWSLVPGANKGWLVQMSMVRAFLSRSPLKHQVAHTSNVRWRILIRQQPVQHTYNRLLSNSKIRKVHDRDSCTGAGEPQPLGPTGHSAVLLGQSVCYQDISQHANNFTLYLSPHPGFKKLPNSNVT